MVSVPVCDEAVAVASSCWVLRHVTLASLEDGQAIVQEPADCLTVESIRQRNETSSQGREEGVKDPQCQGRLVGESSVNPIHCGEDPPNQVD